MAGWPARGLWSRDALPVVVADFTGAALRVFGAKRRADRVQRGGVAIEVEAGGVVETVLRARATH